MASLFERVEQPRPKKALGQNFLQDPNICRKIVSCLDIREGDRIMEIGPGPGALTGILKSYKPAELVLVEKDSYLAARHRAEACQGVRVIEADAMALPYEEYGGGWKIIGNLPYNVASPLMWEIFSRARGIGRAVFMIQKEVGQRIVAEPGTKAYGALTVWVNSFVRPRMEFIVPPHVFYPRPKVDSAVLSFVPHEWNGTLPDLVCLAKTIKAAFQMRRKQIAGILRATGRSSDEVKKCLENIGVSPDARPESIDIRGFHELALSGIFC